MTLVERDFQLILAAALAGERCPKTKPFGPLSQANTVAELIKQGRVRSEVYRYNWRVITIIDGEHKGKSTAPPPSGGRPYLINGVHVDRIARRAGKIAP